MPAIPQMHPRSKLEKKLISFREYIDHLATNSPARFALLVFASTILFFTLLLLIPYTYNGPGSPNFLAALFTATSAVCVTGLTVVEIATFWTPLGHIIIALAVQIGGLGIMTIASILGLAVARHIGLTQRLLIARETKTRLGEVGTLLRAVAITSAVVETLLALALLPTFIAQDQSFIEAVGNAIFASIFTFNNAGFTTLPAGISPFVGNWAFCIPVIIGAMIGAIGFPVALNIATAGRKIEKWTLHTRLTLLTYLGIFLVSCFALMILEWNNVGTYGGLSGNEKVLASIFHAASARSAGLSTVNVGDMHESTWFILDILMFIGGGSASTAGGIKVTTFSVLLLAVLAEARGDRDSEIFGKRISANVTRLAISVTFLGATLVGIATIILLQTTPYSLSQVLFEVISAYATCGLSTGITPFLPGSAQVTLIVLMYLGRAGTMTFAAALALRQRRRVIRLPEERPLIG